MLTNRIIEQKIEAMVINIFQLGLVAERTHPALRDFWNDKIQRHQSRLARFLAEVTHENITR